MPLLGSRGAASLTGFGGLAKLGYLLRNSLRFRASASAYLTRTGGTPSNGKTATYSFWMKRGILSTGTQWLFTGGTTVSLIGFNAGADTLSVFGSDSSAEGNITTAVFRDPAAWYHVVIRINTTEGSAADRAKIYVNGVQQAVSVNNSGIVLDSNWGFNTAGSLAIGRYNPTTSGYSDVYLAEVHFIDGGTPPLPSAFAKTDPATGQWIPIKYSGTYGNNGFYLNFNDTSNTTAATLGKDSSGRGNNWTPNNFSVTAGATYDPVTDVPTLTNATTANYATWNPLVLFPNTTYQATLSNANLLMTRSGGGQGGAVTTIGVTSGKFYAEMPVTAVGSSTTKLGVMATNNPSSISASSEYALGDTSASVAYRSNGARLTGGTTTNSWGSTYTTGDVIGVAFDADTGKVWFGKNGTWQASGDPAAGTNQAATLPTAVPFYFSAGGESGISISLNCGQQPFSYTPPSGFKSLNTFNLP